MAVIILSDGRAIGLLRMCDEEIHMRQFRSAAWLLFVLVCSGSAIAANLVPTGESVPGEVIVKFRANTSAQTVATLESLADADDSQQLANLSSGSVWRLRSSSRSAEAVAAALRNDSAVEYVEPNYVVRLDSTPNDPLYNQLWALKNTGQPIGGRSSAGSDIDIEPAWDLTTGSAAVVVGVVDTGIDYTHPDLAANMWVNPGGKGNAGCAAGTFGFNAVNNTCNPMDDDGHGTHIAGIIGAAGNNGTGVSGVNWTTSLMALKFTNASGYGNVAAAIVAIEFAIQAKIDGVNLRVLSNSWGGFPFSRALLDVINKAKQHDIVFVASAGNSGNSNDITAYYPATYGTDNLISVAATENNDVLAQLSNYGAKTVHLAAPGFLIYSTLPGNAYGFRSGTSTAAPHVAGVAALLLARSPALTTAQVKSAILDSVDRLPSLSTITRGRLNAAKALGATPSPDFFVSMTPTLRTVQVGESASYTVTITPANGFTGSVDLSVTGLPAGATATFTPSSTASTSTLEVVTSVNTPLTSSNLIITATATSGTAARRTGALLTVAPAPPVTPCPSFSVSYGAGAASSIALADITRDGKADVIVTEPASSRVRIYSPNGTSSVHAVGSSPSFVVAADFNRDGRLDLATANSGSNDVSILLASNDGTFHPVAAAYPAGRTPVGLAIGDFNADGKTDLAVANNGSSSVSILLSQGDGSFAPAVSYATGSGTFWVTVADLDRDGQLDLTVANYHDGTVSIVRGNGDGTFQTAVAIAVGPTPSSVAAADFNRDGLVDLAVTNYSTNKVSLLSGNGNATFSTVTVSGVGNRPYGMAAGDIDGDGNVDLVTADSEATQISILRGTGNGFLDAIAVSTNVTGPAQAVIGDVDADGRLDIAVATSGVYSGANIGMTVLRNTGDCNRNCATFAAAVNAGMTTPDSIATGDFNGDGKMDTATLTTAGNSVTIGLGNGDGTFTSGAAIAAGTSPHAIVAGDFNSDGRLDLAIGNPGSNQISVLRGNGDGSFVAAVPYAAGDTPRALAAGDFNRDGKRDLAVAASGSDSVMILLGGAGGTFGTASAFPTGDDPESVAAADFNRDGKLDLVVANASSANVSVLLGNGDGTFQTARNFAAETTPYALVADDFNADGRPDIVVANAGSDSVSLLAGDGFGTFALAQHFATGTTPQALLAFDFNLDGRLDLATANSGSNDVSILLTSASRAFAAAVQIPVGVAPRAIAHGDYNGDGRTDLLVANGGSSTVSLLTNSCPLPDLTLTKTHNGTFTQGARGQTYTVTVTNVGDASTSGPITAADQLPAGLSATSISGAGWTCTRAPLACSRNDALAAGASYPAITVTVNVSSTAPATVTNRVTVIGGGEVNIANNAAADPTSITAVADLTITKSHSGSFIQGATGRTYTLRVRNVGGAATSGTITVTDQLPAGLAATDMTGNGWSCALGTLTCTRADALAAATAFPPITLTVTIAPGAPSQVVNTAAVSGGNDPNVTNNTASDPTLIWSSETCGLFARPVTYPLSNSSQATDMAVADLNGDGRMDVALLSYLALSTMMGLESGGFSAAVNYTLPDSARRIAAADMDHDGDPDLVITIHSGVLVLLNNGNGTFAPGVLYAAPGSASGDALALADVDLDGSIDVLAAATFSSSSSVNVFFGSGTGALSVPVAISVPAVPASIAVTDLDGDDVPDLLISASGQLSVLLGNGSGAFGTPATYASDAFNAIVAADFNGDGATDIAGATYGELQVRLGNGNGTLQAGTSYDLVYGQVSMTTADLNADGKLDLVATGNGRVVILSGNGNATFTTLANHYLGFSPVAVAVTDVNRDSKPDVVIASEYPRSVAIMLGGCPDLTIVKTHLGNFVAGQAGQYMLQVSSTGAMPHGLITVKDILPQGLTATAIFGSNWSCTLATLTCTTTSQLGAQENIIFVSVLVDASAPASVTNTATVSGGGDTNSTNNTATDPTTIVHAPDLTIRKTHVGSFAIDQPGQYTITVGNVGTAPTTGTVTVVDHVPHGMTVTAMSGVGWDCVASAATCTRSDELAITQTYPPITLTAIVTSATSPTITNTAVVSGGGEDDNSNNVAHDVTGIVTTPYVTATASSVSRVNVTWTAVPNATTFEVWRSANQDLYQLVATTISTSFVDTGVVPQKSYRYKVRGLQGNAVGPFSFPDIATTVQFTDDPLTVGVRIKAVHVQELQHAANMLRSLAGLSPVTFTWIVSGMPMQASHMEEIATAFNDARTTLGLSPVAFFYQGSYVRGSHFAQLRSMVQ